MYQGCAEVDGTAAPDAVSLGVVPKYFKSASEGRREVYVTTACYILIKKTDAWCAIHETNID